MMDKRYELIDRLLDFLAEHPELEWNGTIQPNPDGTVSAHFVQAKAITLKTKPITVSKKMAVP